MVGLGNPGQRYADTRHNIGWMVLDRLANRAGVSARVRARDAAATVPARYDGLELLLVKPTTYMNDSGIAVRKILARERAPLDELLVVVDDFALPLGRLRMRERGSAGSHNGLRSIIGELGSQEFARLRVGIGEPGRGATDHVLSRFSADERARLQPVLDAAVDAVDDWARLGAAAAANRWNPWRPPWAEGAEVAALEAGRSTAGPTADRVGDPQAEVGVDGIRRTPTGWRKLLPGSGGERSGERGRRA